MKLIRMKLDTKRRDTLKALSSPNLIHGALETAFAGERQHPLWRIDAVQGQHYLLTVCRDIPDFTTVIQQFGCPEAVPAWQVKDYDPFLSRIETGGQYRFRLVANPTFCNGGDASEGTRGKVHAHSTLANQMRWLAKQGERHGFSVQEEEYQVIGQQWLRFYKNGKRPVTMLSVAYEGILTVTDTALFIEALCFGIGRGKAYGMGLMTVVKFNG